MKKIGSNIFLIIIIEEKLPKKERDKKADSTGAYSYQIKMSYQIID